MRGRGLLECVWSAPGALFLAVFDALIELSEQFAQRGAQGVIDGFREDVRPGRHEMGRDPEGRALFEPALDEHSSFVDLQSLAQRFQTLFNQRGEGWRGLVMAVSKDEFHDAPTFTATSGFDKDAISKLS